MDEGMFRPLDEGEIDQAAGAQPTSASGTKVPIIPVPDDAPPMRFRHPKHGNPTKVWPYHDGEGRLVGYAARFDFVRDDGTPDKEVRPVTFCDLGNGRCAWGSKGIPAPRPLYRLPELLARPDAWVIVAEGEKAADATAVLFPDMVATSPMHGAKSPHKTDFGPCAGRMVVISPDNDTAGQGFADRVFELARAAGAVQVLLLQPDRLGNWIWKDGERVRRDAPIPEGWDLADALGEGWTAETVSAVRTDPGFLIPYAGPAELVPLADPVDPGQTDQDTMANWATEWPFRLTSRGVERGFEKVDPDTGDITTRIRGFRATKGL